MNWFPPFSFHWTAAVFAAVGYSVACFGGHWIVKPLMLRLRERSPDHHYIPKPHAFWQGVVERAIYTTSILLGKPEGIAAWLAFKALWRWKPTEKFDSREPEQSAMYLIGTGLNVLFGIAGGVIATYPFWVREAQAFLL